MPAMHRVEDFAQAIRAIGEPIHSRTADQISMAKLLTLLFEITALFDMRTRIELVMLQKTMVVVEGVGRTLDPRLDMWSTSEPVVRSWIEDNLGPAGKLEDAATGAHAPCARSPSACPRLLARAEKIALTLEDAAERGLGLVDRDDRGAGQARPEVPLMHRWLALAHLDGDAAIVLVMQGTLRTAAATPRLNVPRPNGTLRRRLGSRPGLAVCSENRRSGLDPKRGGL